MAKQGSHYFVEQQERGWAVCYHKNGAKVTLCTASTKNYADAVQLAMSVFPYAQKAAGELADNVQDGPGQLGLIAIFQRLHELERKAAVQRDIETFFSNLWNVATGIMAGIGILTIIVMIIRFFFL